MSKKEQERNIKGFRKDLSYLLKRDTDRDINQVYEDTRYAGI